MNHIRPFTDYETPTLRTAMATTMPPAEQARLLAMRLNRDLDAGAYARLNADRLCDLRGVVWALDGLAVAIDAMQPVPMRRSRAGWWWRIWG